MAQEQEEQYAEDIIASTSYDAALPNAKKSFLPWHKPRKQFVRDKQWREQIERLIPELNTADSTLKYLGLPGTDLLDIRYFHDSVCKSHKKKLFYIGFNSAAISLSAAQVELNISLDEVNKLPDVIPGSEVITDDFRMVANTNSYAHRQTLKHGPYDIVNLDLCDSFGNQPPASIELTHYSAVSQLLAIQARTKTPWLLLLTTRVGPSHVDQELLDIFVKKFNENLLECEAFRANSQKHFNINDSEQLDEIIKNCKGHSDVFLTGICKWLIGIAVIQNPPTIVELKSALGYRVEAGAEDLDLVSLAIKFTPTVHALDPMGLAGKQPDQLKECDFAPNLVSRLANRVDVDNVLAADQTMMESMSSNMADLLNLARYDLNEFKSWLAQGCPAN